MGVQIDQSRDQDVIFKSCFPLCLVTIAGLAGREYCEDASLVDGDGMVLEYDVRFYWSNPARLDQKVYFFRCCCHETASVGWLSRVKIANYARLNQ